MSTIDTILNKYARDIDDTIKRVLADTPYFMHGVISYHFGWVDQTFKPASFSRGKMFRPTLNLLVFEAVRGDHHGALPAAAAIEMIHNFSLIHDDIEDDDLERRGRPAAWTVWGKPRMINAGDFLYSLSFKALSQLDPRKFPPETILAVHRLINQACLELTLGQDLDLSFETLQEVSTEMYIDMVYKKTGALVEAAVLSGVVLATSEESLIQNYHTFAQNIGIAFQIRDDILGIWGDVAQTGKSSVNDLQRKKKTLPIIYMLDQSSGARGQKLRGYYAHPQPLSDEAVEFVRESLDLVDAYDYAQGVAHSYREKAFGALEKINISNQAQSELEVIAKFLVDRSY